MTNGRVGRLDVIENVHCVFVCLFLKILNTEFVWKVLEFVTLWSQLRMIMQEITQS